MARLNSKARRQKIPVYLSGCLIWPQPKGVSRLPLHNQAKRALDHSLTQNSISLFTGFPR